MYPRFFSQPITLFAKLDGRLAVNGYAFDFCSFASPLQIIYGISPTHIVEFRQREIGHFYRRANRQAIRVFLDVVNAIDQALKEISVIPRAAGAASQGAAVSAPSANGTAGTSYACSMSNLKIFERLSEWFSLHRK